MAKHVECCTVGELAEALNRSSVTIRTREREGVIPPSGYRHSIEPRPQGQASALQPGAGRGHRQDGDEDGS
jgi:hypothetical protein